MASYALGATGWVGEVPLSAPQSPGWEQARPLCEPPAWQVLWCWR